MLWGVNLQLLLALLVLRWSVGFTVIQWISDRFVTYIDYTIAGSEFVFGKEYFRHWFAFKVSVSGVVCTFEKLFNFF